MVTVRDRGGSYALNAIALVKEPDTALWLNDLLQKLGREDDAYDAEALVLPDLRGDPETAGSGDRTTQAVEGWCRRRRD